MANRWGNNGNSERLNFFWGGSPKSLQMVTAAMIKRCLLLGRKAVTDLDSLLKNRDITLSTRVHRGKAMVFLAVMENFSRIDALESLFLRRLWRVPQTARRSNQLILKDKP